MAAFPGGTPRRDDLDRAVPDRPAFFVNRDGHGAWANSRALALAGIDRDTPDPADGRIERDPDGTPSGTLHEGAMRLDRAAHPASRRRRTSSRGLGDGAGRPALPGHHGLAGRARCRRRDLAAYRTFAEPGPAHRPGDRRPALGRGPRAGADRRDDRRAARLGAGPPARHEREDLPGRGDRELLGGDARSVPRTGTAGPRRIAATATWTRTRSRAT